MRRQCLGTYSRPAIQHALTLLLLSLGTPNTRPRWEPTSFSASPSLSAHALAADFDDRCMWRNWCKSNSVMKHQLFSCFQKFGMLSYTLPICILCRMLPMFEVTEEKKELPKEDLCTAFLIQSSPHTVTQLQEEDRFILCNRNLYVLLQSFYLCVLLVSIIHKHWFLH